jgi:hypothetical protein
MVRTIRTRDSTSDCAQEFLGFPDTFSSETLLVPDEASHSSVFIPLLALMSGIFAPLFSITCAFPFRLLQTSGPPSRFFSITSILFARVRVTRRAGRTFSPPKYLHQLARQRTGTGRCSQCLYFVTSLLPDPAPRNLIRRLIILWRRDTEPTPRSVGVYSSFRARFRCPGLKWSPGFRVCACKP